jgi:adenylate cyclase
MQNAQFPRLAILPFDNFTGNVDQDYFSRGFVEDLIVDLSRYSNLEIISSNTSLLSYKIHY